MEQNGTTSPTQWEKYLFGNQSPLLPVFLLQHKPPRAFGDLQWLLCRWHHSQERRGRSWCDCGARGGDGAAAAAAELRSLALEGLPAALLPLTASPSQPQRLMSAHFNESFSILILFFFPGVLTDLWTTQYPLFAVLQCQAPQSVYIAGVYSFKI